MEFKYRYLGKSTAASDSRSTEVTFTPDSLRPPTWFVGQLHQRIGFREAISALHDGQKYLVGGGYPAGPMLAVKERR